MAGKSVTEETKRDASPCSNFTWTIQSFSSFSKLKLEKYYSGVFVAGSYKWKLLVYPKGKNVKDQLSLYLELEDTDSLSSSSGIYVDYTLSLLDQITHKHKKKSGTRQLINSKQNWCGSKHFIPLDTFNDPSKGYLVDDTCVFGAKVVLNGETDCSTNVCGNWVGLTVEEAIPTKFSWKVDEFSKLKPHTEYKSEVFAAGNYKWQVEFYSKGNRGDNVSVFLGVADSATLSKDWEVYVEYSLFLLDQIHGKHKVEKSQHRFTAQELDWGWWNFLPRSNLYDTTKGFLVNDTCVVEAEVVVPRMVSYCSFKSEKETSYASSHLANARDCPSYKFSWSVDKFSQLNTNKLHSESFTAGGYKWRLMLISKPNNVDQLSLYLEAVESESLPAGWRIYVQSTFSLLNMENKDLTITKDTWHQFNACENCWGFEEFMPLAVLFNKCAGYLSNDKLLLEAEVSVFRAVDYWSYDSRKVTGYVDFKNSGSNSCLNSYLQILYHIPYFKKAVLHMPGSGSYLPSHNIVSAMQHLFHKLENSDVCVSTKKFSNYFGCSTYDSHLKHEMHELICALFAELEDEIRGMAIEAKVKQLFGGQFFNCIDCINGDYKPELKELFYDLLLDVKGCKDVYSSLDLLVRREHFDCASKHRIEQHGMQDSRKGDQFVNLPPVLQLVLKRFEFDYGKNTMIKIDDCYEFPLQLDLDIENGKYLSSGTTRTIRNLYTLHSIVVHRGSVHGGHYYCLMRPNLSDQWLKFKDGRVTKEDLNVLPKNCFGGMGEEIYSNACMLVYIRECDKEMVIASEGEVDYNEELRLGEGHKVPRCKEKKKSEESIYIIIKVSRHEDFVCQIGRDIYFDLVDHENVCRFRVRNDMPFLQFKEDVAREFGTVVQFQRFWLWTVHPNETYRPYWMLTQQEELQSVGKLWLVGNVHMELHLFLDVEVGPNLLPISPLEKDKEDILIFFKVYDPRDENFRYMGRLYVNGRSKPTDILPKLKEMARFPANKEIELFKEIGFTVASMCQRVDKGHTFRKNMLKDGDIICYQLVLPAEERKRCLHPDVPSFLNFVREHQMWYKRRCAKLTDQRNEMEALVVREAARRLG